MHIAIWRRKYYMQVFKQSMKWEGTIFSYIFLYRNCSILNISLMIFDTWMVTAFTLQTWTSCYYRFNVICDSFVLQAWYKWTAREWLPTPFDWVRYGGFNFTELSKVPSLDTCLFYMLKDSRWRWTSVQLFVIGREIRWSVCCVSKDACFVKPYAS